MELMDSRNICPTGWHIPTKLEWEELLDIFGDQDPENANRWNQSGAALKDINYWSNGLLYSTNYSHMSVYPSGNLDWLGGNLNGYNSMTRIWTSTTTEQSGPYSSFSNYWFVFEDVSIDVSQQDYDQVGLANCRCKKD